MGITRRSVVVVEVFFLLLILQSCSSVPRGDAVATFVAQQRSLGLSLQAKGEGARALEHWHLLLLAQPGDIEAQKHTALLAKQLKKTADESYKKGLKAFRRGQIRGAKKYFLATLAAQPHHGDALAKLQTLQLQRMERYQYKKPSSKLSGALAGHGEKKKNKSQAGTNRVDSKALLAAHIRRIKSYLRDNKLEQADAQYRRTQAMLVTADYALLPTSGRQGDVVEDAQARQQLAVIADTLGDAFYRAARKIMTKSLDQAIGYLHTSLHYSANDEKALALLARSLQLRDKLTKIKAGQPR